MRLKSISLEVGKYHWHSNNGKVLYFFINKNKGNAIPMAPNITKINAGLKFNKFKNDIVADNLVILDILIPNANINPQINSNNDIIMLLLLLFLFLLIIKISKNEMIINIKRDIIENFIAYDNDKSFSKVGK